MQRNSAENPPLVLLGSTEGLSLLIKVRRRPTLTYWAALAMTLLLAAAAFRLSFDALRDLAVLCGIRPGLAWLWPLVVDVTITQATVSLLALSRQDHTYSPATDSDGVDAPELADEVGQADDVSAGIEASVVAMVPVQRELSVGGGDHHDDRTVRAVMASNRTKQPPEVVRAILDRHANGHKTTDIANAFKLHHTTVSRIVATAMDRRTAVG